MKRTKTNHSVAAAFDRMNTPADSGPLLGRVQPREVAAPVHTTKPLEQLTRQVLLGFIELDPDQVRQEIDPDQLLELSDSIRQFGVLQYVTLQKLPNSDRYRVIAGHRRVLAARLAHLDAVPAVIRPDDYGEQQRMLEQLVENTQRVNLTAVEEARRYRLLMDTFQLSQQQLAKLISRPRARIVEHLGILRIPEELLERAKGLPQQTLVEISKAPTSEMPHLVDLALNATGTLKEVKEGRSNRTPQTPRVVYYSESFIFENEPAVEIRWKVAPEDATPDQLVRVLGRVIADLQSRRAAR